MHAAVASKFMAEVAGVSPPGQAELDRCRQSASAIPDEHPVAELVDDDGEDEKRAQQHHLHVGTDLHEVDGLVPKSE